MDTAFENVAGHPLQIVPPMIQSGEIVGNIVKTKIGNVLKGDSAAIPQTVGISEKKELSEQDIVRFTDMVIGAISGEKKEINPGLDETNFKDFLEEAMLKNVTGLPELLARRLTELQPELFQQRGIALAEKMSAEQDPHQLAELQMDLIFQTIHLISRVQNGGCKGITPSVAREVNGMDCSLSAWALKQKLIELKIPNIEYQFGYVLMGLVDGHVSGHAVGIVQLADGRNLYVDAQDGCMAEVKLKEVKGKSAHMAYPIFEIVSSTRVVRDIPFETGVSPQAEYYIPRYLGIRADGLLHTIGNFNMIGSFDSSISETEASRSFRAELDSMDDGWQKFVLFQERIAGGTTIEKTEYAEPSQAHAESWRRSKKTALNY